MCLAAIVVARRITTFFQSFMVGTTQDAQSPITLSYYTIIVPIHQNFHFHLYDQNANEY